VWERYYLFIAFFSLLAIGLLLGRALEWAGSRDRGSLLGAAILVGVVAVGVFDQTSNSDPAYVPPYANTAAQWRSDERFVSAIESRLPAGADVYELPYVPYPEAQRSSRTRDFDPVRPYLHSSDLRWSYGAMLNRPADWQAALMDKPFGLVPPSLSAAGFEGVVVDRLAYPDDGARVERTLERSLRARPLASPNGRFWFFDMRPYAGRLGASLAPGGLDDVRAATLHPLRAAAGDGLVRFTVPGSGATGAFQLAEPTATLELENPSETERTGLLRVDLGGDAVLSLGLPGGATRTLRAGRAVEDRVVLPPGTTGIAVSLADPGSPGQPIYIRTELRDEALAPIARGVGPRRVPPPPTLFGGDSAAGPGAVPGI
jgi:hypothetical protein